MGKREREKKERVGSKRRCGVVGWHVREEGFGWDSEIWTGRRGSVDREVRVWTSKGRVG